MRLRFKLQAAADANVVVVEVIFGDELPLDRPRAAAVFAGRVPVPLRVADRRDEVANLRIGKHEVQVPLGRRAIINAARRQDLHVHPIEIHGAEQDIELRRERNVRQPAAEEADRIGVPEAEVAPHAGAKTELAAELFRHARIPREVEIRIVHLRRQIGLARHHRSVSGPCSQLNAKPGVTNSGVSMLYHSGNANVLDASARVQARSCGSECLPYR